MKTLYVHIGTPKTGSSYLQKYLKANALKLEKKGLYYPCSPNKLYFPPAEQHVSLISSIIGHRVPWLNPKYHLPNGEALQQLLEDLQSVNQEKILISSEVFYDVFINKEMIYKLKKAFNDYKVKIIVYLRRQDKYLLSYFQQSCKAGEETSFQFNKLFSTLEDSLKYYRRLLMWSDIFGVDNIIVRPFETIQMEDEDLVTDFLSVLGIYDKSDLKKIQRVNESISLEKVLFLLEINKYLCSLNGNESWETKMLHASIRNRIIRADNILKNGNVDQLISREQKELIHRSFYAENENIAKVFLGRPNGDLFTEKTDLENSIENIEVLSKDSEYEAITSLLIDIQTEVIKSKQK